MAYYEADKIKMKTILKDLPDKISFITDCWTSPFTKLFLLLTAHFINKEWELQNIIKDEFLIGIKKISLENKVN